MAPAPGLWAPLAIRVFRHAFKEIKARLPEIVRPINGKLQPLARTTPRHSIHPAAFLRQRKGRWYTTHSHINAAVRRFMSTGPGHGIGFSRAAAPQSATATAVARLTSRAPFASTLRPNITGGTIPRTAGGYTIGGGRVGGVRYFSHTPAAPAQVMSNVSAAVRAFWLSGQKAQFDGMNPAGEKRYRSITTFQEESGKVMRSMPRHAPGSFIDFCVNPTITALTPLGAMLPCSSIEQTVPNLNTEGFLDVLSVDFARALKDLAATMNDLKRLSSLGDLPITLEQKSILRVRFPGCAAETVERLCDEVGVQRGIIHQDPDFESSCGANVALIFPFAPTSDHTLSSPGGSLRSDTGHDYEAVEQNLWLEGYESMENSSNSDHESVSGMKQSALQNSSSDYEGLEGIYRFLEECDNSRRI